MDRRRFLQLLAAGAGGMFIGPHFPGLSSRGLALTTFPGREASHYRRLNGGRTECLLCPHHCLLSRGEAGFCRTRINRGGRLYTTAFNNPCIILKDPIEKGPLYHFLPGAITLSLATAGCNLRYRYCQNWQAAMSSPSQTENLPLTARDVTARANEQQAAALIYTYTEPVAYYDYLTAVAKAAGAAGLKNCVCTAAYIRPKPLREICRLIDGFTVSLKGFNESFYRETIGGSLKPVLDALVTIKESGGWLEIIYLAVPDHNTNPVEIRAASRWIKHHLGSDTPLHFARFWPSYRMKNLPPTPVAMMENCRRIAQESGLSYIYLNNLPGHRAEHTYCPGCGRPLIERLGFSVIKNRLRNGKCPYCRRLIPGVWG